MRIGYIRSDQIISLNINESKINHLHWRAGFIKTLIEMGHEIVFYTPFLKDEQRILDSGKLDSNWKFDVSWMLSNKFMTHYDGYPMDDNCDVLIVESGSMSNFRYVDKINRMPAIRRFLEVVNNFKGVVFWYQVDAEIPFQFAKYTGLEEGCKYWWGHKKNGYCYPTGENRGELWTALSSFGNYYEVFKDKVPVLMLQTQRDRYIDQYFEDSISWRKRVRYDLFTNLYVERYTQCLVDSLYGSFRFKKNPKNTLIYYGRETAHRGQNKRNEIKKFLSGIKHDVLLYGDWRKQNELFQSEHFDIRPVTPRWKLMQAINNSYACLHIMGKINDHVGCVTNRFFEIITARCLVLSPYYECLEGLLGKQFFIKNGDDLNKTLKWLREMHWRDRKFLVRQQYKNLIDKGYTYKDEVEKFLRLYKEYGGDYNSSHFKIVCKDFVNNSSQLIKEAKNLGQKDVNYDYKNMGLGRK